MGDELLPRIEVGRYIDRVLDSEYSRLRRLDTRPAIPTVFAHAHSFARFLWRTFRLGLEKTPVVAAPRSFRRISSHIEQTPVVARFLGNPMKLSIAVLGDPPDIYGLVAAGEVGSLTTIGGELPFRPGGQTIAGRIGIDIDIGDSSQIIRNTNINIPVLFSPVYGELVGRL